MFSAFRRVRRTTSLGLLVASALHLTGCAQWQPVTTPATDLATVDNQAVFRFHLRDGTVLDLRSVRLVGDSIVGVRAAVGQHLRGDTTRVIALTQVRAAERSVGDPGGTVAGAGILALLVLGVALAASDPCVAAFC